MDPQLSGASIFMCIVTAVGSATLLVSGVGAFLHRQWRGVKLRPPLLVWTSGIWSLLISLALTFSITDAPRYATFTFWVGHLTPSLYGGPYIIRGLHLLLLSSTSHRRTWSSFLRPSTVWLVLAFLVLFDVAGACASDFLMPMRFFYVFEEWPVYLTALVIYASSVLVIGRELVRLKVRDSYSIAEELLTCCVAWGLPGSIFLFATSLVVNLPDVQATMRAYFPQEIFLAFMIAPLWYKSFLRPFVLGRESLNHKVHPVITVGADSLDTVSTVASDDRGFIARVELAWRDAALRSCLCRAATARLCPELPEFLSEWERLLDEVRQVTADITDLSPVVAQALLMRRTFINTGSALELNLSFTMRQGTIAALEQATAAATTNTDNQNFDSKAIAKLFVIAFAAAHKECMSLLHSAVYAELLQTDASFYAKAAELTTMTPMSQVTMA